MQFLARERSYPRVDDRIILLNGRPIGRMMVDRGDDSNTAERHCSFDRV